MSLGMEQGRPVAEYFEKSGVNPLFTTIPVMLVLLSGTLVTTIIWCLYLGIRNRSLNDYLQCRTPKTLTGNYIFALVSRIALVHAIYFLRNGKEQNGALHIYIMGNTGGPDNSICNSLGIIQERMERCFNKSLYHLWFFQCLS